MNWKSMRAAVDAATTDEQLDKVYTAAAHCVQTGIAARMQFEDKFVNQKHIRTGLDLRAADMKGLVELLIAKGVFTREEYGKAITKATIDEAEDYERYIQKTFHPGFRIGG